MSVTIYMVAYTYADGHSPGVSCIAFRTEAERKEWLDENLEFLVKESCYELIEQVL